jgi:hypothetical protein
VLLALYVYEGLGAEQVNRNESVALLKELGAHQLVSPIVVSIEHQWPDSYLLKIKGDYNLQAMKIFLKKKFSVEENKDYIVISEL